VIETLEFLSNIFIKRFKKGKLKRKKTYKAPVNMILLHQNLTTLNKSDKKDKSKFQLNKMIKFRKK
jgi:hypothetical protein